MAVEAEPWPNAVSVDTSGTSTAALAEVRRIVEAG
jgi:hypothetical protein